MSVFGDFDSQIYVKNRFSRGEGMAKDSKFSFEFWLHKTIEWGQISTSESQQDVCLHLPELQEFLLQIYGALKHMNCSTAVQEFPLIGQLLGRLCWNPFVIGYDECQKILMWCLCCLYSGEPQNPVELKANSWIQHQAACHPAAFRTIDEIFKNALLETDGAPEVMTVMQVFTQCFVQAYHKNNKQFKFPLKAYFPHNPHSLVMALLKHPSDLPATGLHQHLTHIAEMLKAAVEAKCTGYCGDLFENWFLFVRFGEWADIAAEQLLSQAESSDALLWLLAFYYNPGEEDRRRTQTMVEARSVCDHLTVLFRTPTISVTDLQTAVSSGRKQKQSSSNLAVTHLIISFLLFTPTGHTVAEEFITHFVVAGSEIPEVTGLLTRLADRVGQLGMKHQRTLKLVNDLLLKLKCGV